VTVVLLVLGAATGAEAGTSGRPPGAALKRLVTALGGDATEAGGAGYLHLQKLDSNLQGLVADDLENRDARAPGRRRDIDVSAGQRVLVDVYVNDDVKTAAGMLQRAGMEVKAASARPPVGVVEGRAPLAGLPAIAQLEATKAIEPVTARGVDTLGGADTGSVLSQGDAAHNGPAARALGGGVTGAGVTVGVISDSIDRVGSGVAGSQSTGDLPPPPDVTVLGDDPAGTDEGRAMAEIVYDEAPGADAFLFDSGTASGAVGKANAIDNLVANGAQVIADDIFYLTEPMFQEGAVAQAVDDAKANGVAYVASAGNRARQSYEATFSPTGPNFHDFGGGDTQQTIVTVPDGRFIQIVLQWDEPWGQASTNLDAFLYNVNTSAQLTSAQTSNTITGLPLEVLTWSNTTGSSVPVALQIKRFSGTRTPFMKYIVRGNFGAFTVAEHDTSSAAINPDAASASGSLAVAAVAYNEPGLDQAEPFSSRGPVRRLFDVNGVRLATPQTVQKPQIAAADGVSTSVTGFNPFFGTSAATPSAAGVAALLRSANQTMSVDELNAIMTDPANSIDCLASGNPDNDCGAGFILADGAVTQSLDSTPPVLTPHVTPPAPSGQNGWYQTDVGVTWDTEDPDSPISTTSGCGATSVTSDTTVTLGCLATSAGGTQAESVTIRRDTTAPATPKFTGIGATTYPVTALPGRTAVGCTSGDVTSGIAAGGCVVSGYDSSLGRHTLTATVVDNAGLKSTATMTYVVVDPFNGVKLRRRATVRGRFARIAVSCPAATPGRCIGRLRLRTAARPKRKLRPLSLGTRRFAIAPGRTRTVLVRLSRAGLRLLKGDKPLKAVARATSRDGLDTTKVTTSRLTLEPKKRAATKGASVIWPDGWAGLLTGLCCKTVG
jgi:hypothetical protein